MKLKHSLKEMKPRILITIDTYAIGGAGKVILQFLKNGGAELCEPQLAGFWRGPDGTWQFRDAVESLGVKFNVLKQKSAFDPLVIADVCGIVRDSRIDILESHGYKAHVVCYMVKELTGLPWLAYVHGWTNENVKMECYNLIDKMIVRFADKILSVSASLNARLHLGKKAREKAIIVANAADFVELSASKVATSSNPQAEQLIALIGRLSPEKGHSYFIDAFKVLCETNLSVKAMFVGDGQEREALEKKIVQEGLGDKILLTGYREDVSQFYHACDIVCIPSVSEGMPNVALEAMMYAKPVVASNVGGIPDVVLDKETGYLVEPRNPGALATALGDLLGDRQKRLSMGAAGRHRVEAEFNPGARTQKVLNIYHSLLEELHLRRYQRSG